MVEVGCNTLPESVAGEYKTLDDMVVDYKALKPIKVVKQQRSNHLQSSTQAILPRIQQATVQVGRYT